MTYRALPYQLRAPNGRWETEVEGERRLLGETDENGALVLHMPVVKMAAAAGDHRARRLLVEMQG